MVLLLPPPDHEGPLLDFGEKLFWPTAMPENNKTVNPTKNNIYESLCIQELFYLRHRPTSVVIHYKSIYFL
jgi:hypothetical protein